MTDSSEVPVFLNPKIAAIVRQAVESGEYASDGEVVREAILEWRLRRTLNDTESAAIRRLWDEGIASGRGRFGSMDEIKQAARRRWATAPSA